MRSEVHGRVRLAAALGFLFSAVHAAQSHAGTAGRIDHFVRAEMERQRIPGAAIGVLKGGKVVLARGYGLANVERGVPVVPETVFHAASVGKQFTAAAVMLLVQEGKLALDVPITRYLAGAPAAWAPITLRHLLTHTSGLPDYAEAVDFHRDDTEEEMEKICYGLRPQFPAGTRWSYSNTGYLLAGIIIHKVSGRFWGDYLREQVFLPLGMKTARVVADDEAVSNRAASYQTSESGLRAPDSVAPRWSTTADGGVSLSVLDLITWVRALHAGKVLDSRSWAQVFEPVRLDSGHHFPYGFGWYLDEAGGRTVRRHCGDWHGFRLCLADYPADDLTVMVLTNLGEAVPSLLVRGIVAIVEPALGETPAPIADTEPEVTSRLRTLLASPGESDLPEGYAAFFPGDARGYGESRALLRQLGSPDRLDLVARREFGDDLVYVYLATYPRQTLEVAFGLTRDGHVSHFCLRPVKPRRG
jgi:CubicO group peptidase (beta-lactamase class C family)